MMSSGGRGRARARVAAVVAGLCAACSPFAASPGDAPDVATEAGVEGAPATEDAPGEGGASPTRRPATPGRACDAIRDGEPADDVVACEDFEPPPAGLPVRFAAESDGDLFRAAAAREPAVGVSGTTALRIRFAKEAGLSGGSWLQVRELAPTATRVALTFALAVESTGAESDAATLASLELYDATNAAWAFQVRLAGAGLELAVVAPDGTVAKTSLAADAPRKATTLTLRIERSGGTTRAVVSVPGGDVTSEPVALREVTSMRVQVGIFQLTSQSMAFDGTFDDLVLRAR